MSITVPLPQNVVIRFLMDYLNLRKLAHSLNMPSIVNDLEAVGDLRGAVEAITSSSCFESQRKTTIPYELLTCTPFFNHIVYSRKSVYRILIHYWGTCVRVFIAAFEITA